jgi:hypothetical protein
MGPKMPYKSKYMELGDKDHRNFSEAERPVKKLGDLLS